MTQTTTHTKLTENNNFTHHHRRFHNKCKYVNRNPLVAPLCLLYTLLLEKYDLIIRSKAGGGHYTGLRLRRCGRRRHHQRRPYAAASRLQKRLHNLPKTCIMTWPDRVIHQLYLRCWCRRVDSLAASRRWCCPRAPVAHHRAAVAACTPPDEDGGDGGSGRWRDAADWVAVGIAAEAYVSCRSVRRRWAPAAESPTSESPAAGCRSCGAAAASVDLLETVQRMLFHRSEIRC